MGGGRGLAREGACAHTQLMHAGALQEQTQYCKPASLPFKKRHIRKGEGTVSAQERKSEGAESFKMEEEARNVNMRASRVED